MLRLACVTVNEKAPNEKFAATQKMLSDKSYKMTINVFNHFIMTYRICLLQIKEVMIENETYYSKSVP